MADEKKEFFDRKEVYIGRDFGGITYDITPDLVATYVAGTGDDNSWYRGPSPLGGPTMKSSLSVRVTNSVVEVHVLESHLTEANVEPVGEKLYELAAQAAQNTLRLDFSAVKYLTSSILGRLVLLHKRMINTGGHFQVVNLGPEVYEICKVTRLDTFIDLQPMECRSRTLCYEGVFRTFVRGVNR